MQILNGGGEFECLRENHPPLPSKLNPVSHIGIYAFHYPPHLINDHNQPDIVTVLHCY